MALEARHEIDDADRVAGFRAQGRDQDGGIAVIGLGRRGISIEYDVAEPDLVFSGGRLGEQAAEDRVAVQPRMAIPHDPAPPVDQRSHDAIADDGEV